MTRSRATAKKAGTEMESAIVTRLKAAFPENDGIERRPKGGAKDRGDISGIRTALGERLVIEAKNVATMNLQGWLREAEVERGNDDAAAGVVVHKRRGVGLANMDEQYVTMTFADFIVLIGGNRASQVGTP